MKLREEGWGFGRTLYPTKYIFCAEGLGGRRTHGTSAPLKGQLRDESPDF